MRLKQLIVVSKQTITRTLQKNGAQGQRPRKTSLLQNTQLQARLTYAKDHACWNCAQRDAAYVWKKKGVAYNPKNSLCSMLLWECFSASGSGEFCDSGNNYEERRIYEDSENFKLSAVKRELVHTSSHSSNKTKTQNWPVQSPDLNPIDTPIGWT